VLPLLADQARRAAQVLPPAVQEYYAGGSGSEVALDEAPAAWAALRFRPRVLRDVGSVDTSLELLGAPLATPVLVAPSALHGLAHPDGERATARGTAAAGTPPERAYRLVVTVSDLSRRRLVPLPWDLPLYGTDADDYPVARAVRASAAIPLYFRPVRQPTPDGEATWVDGGLLSNFPIGLFDRADSLEPRWPTFGVRLTTRPATPPATAPVEGPLGIGLAALDTLLTDQGSTYLEDPCTVERTVFVPTEGVSVVDFDLSREAQDRLYASGRAAAQEFLSRWDFAAHVRRCRRGVPPA
jgi:predicted acylesterase/phospholipase RssA